MKRLRDNTIYTLTIPNGERCYCICENRSGARAIFDHDKNLRREMVEMLIETGSRFVLDKHSGTLRLSNTGEALSAWVYRTQYGHSREEMRGKVIRHRHRYICGNIEDCRGGNLGTLAEIGDNNKNRCITHDENYIYLQVFAIGAVDYLTYSSGLYELLSYRGFSYVDDGSGRIRINYANKRVCRLHHLSYAYYEKLIDENSTVEDIRRVVATLTAGGMEIDHADNNGHNNTKLNLSLMPGPLNNRKSDIVTHFTPPEYTVVSIYMDGAYFIELSSRTALRPAQEMREMLERGKWPENMEEFTMLHNMSSYIEACLDSMGYPAPTTTTHYGMSTIFCKCNTPKGYVEQLKDFASSTYSWTSTEATPQEEWRQNKGSFYWASNASLSLAAQKKLAEDVRERGHLFL